MGEKSPKCFPAEVSVSCAIPTLAYDATWHTPNPGIFRTMSY